MRVKRSLLRSGIAMLAVVTPALGQTTPTGTTPDGVEAPFSVSVHVDVARDREVTISVTGGMQPWADDPGIWRETSRSEGAVAVSIDRHTEPCPADIEDLPDEGWWLTQSGDTMWEDVLEVGAMEWTGSFTPGLAAEGHFRVCAYLWADLATVYDDDADEVLPGDEYTAVGAGGYDVTSASGALPTSRVVGLLLHSRTIPGDAKRAIRAAYRHQGGRRLWNRAVDVTGEGNIDNVVYTMAGRSGQTRAYYIVTRDGGAARVVAGLARARGVWIHADDGTFTEEMPWPRRPGYTSVRRFRWDGMRFHQAGVRRIALNQDGH